MRPTVIGSFGGVVTIEGEATCVTFGTGSLRRGLPTAVVNSQGSKILNACFP